jgi:uncharacterized membrane protein
MHETARMNGRVDDRLAREAQLEATLAILLVMLLQTALAAMSLASGWHIWGAPGWVWAFAIVPELLLLGALDAHIRRHGTEQLGRRRRLSLTLVGVVAVFNLAALVLLVGSLLTSHEHGGGELLFKAMTIWSTNVVTFGLLFWELDAGGPISRQTAGARDFDFLFPQQDDPERAPVDWHPRLFDYAYTSFTNSIAFSPTDVMPLTQRAKMLMLAESAISATTILLAAARAVNILQ